MKRTLSTTINRSKNEERGESQPDWDGLVVVSSSLRAQLLADAIPATSFAAGSNPVSTNAVCGNISYETCKSGGWPIGESVWRHSDLKNVAYFFNWKLFYRIKNNDGGDKNGTQQQNGD